MTGYAYRRYRIISHAQMQMAACRTDYVDVPSLADELDYDVAEVREVLEGVKPKIKLVEVQNENESD